jgi:sulfite exporter TauE/SafE
MSLIPEIPNVYLGALAGGLLYGSILCTSACLPYVASYIAGIGAGFRKGVMVTLIFSLGRIAAYALIGGLVAIFAVAFGWLVSEATMFSVQQYSSYVFGAVSIAVGALLLLKSRTPKPSCDCDPKEAKNLTAPRAYRRFDVGAFSLGLTRGLVLCPPLVFLLVYAVSFAAPIDSFIWAVLFGLGTTLSPILLLGGATGWLLSKAPLLRKWISMAGAAVLIILGAATLITALTTGKIGG